MWRTPEGVRVLSGSEWELFREGLSLLWDEIEDGLGEPGEEIAGVEVFDKLEPDEKLATSRRSRGLCGKKEKQHPSSAR